MSDNEHHVRSLLWLRHGCPIVALYGDDGEMQCNACGIDFKRMTGEQIETRFRRGTAAHLAASDWGRP